MQEQFPIERNPSKRRLLGTPIRIFRDFITGGDAGYTLLKAGIIVTLAVVGSGISISTFGIPIIVAGGVVGIYYVAFSIKEEYDRLKEENKKLATLTDLEAEMDFLNMEVDPNQLLPGIRKTAEFNLSAFNNAQLLKILLRDYLHKLNLLEEGLRGPQFEKRLNAKRRANGSLPGQEGMIRLIESVIGVNRRDPKFTTKLKQFLASDLPENQVPGLNLNEDFASRLCKSLSFADHEEENAPPVNPGFFSQAIQFFTNKQGMPRRATRFVKNIMLGLARGNTAAGLVVGSSLLLGILVVGTAPAWPILVGAVGIGLLSSGASIIYGRYIEKSYKQNVKNLNIHIDEKKTRYKLLTKLKKINQKNYRDLNVYAAPSPSVIRELAENYDLVGRIEPTPYQVPFLTRARIAIDTGVQYLYGGSAGALIGLSLTAVSLLLVGLVFPPVGGILTATLAGLVVGGLFGLRYSRLMGKATSKGGAKEIATMTEVAYLKEDCERKLGDRGPSIVKNQLEKSKRKLVLELLIAYSNLVARQQSTYSRLAEARPQNEVRILLDKKEKILRQIEEATGITRKRDPQDRLPLNGDAKFYNKLSSYLQEDKKISNTEANVAVSNFKTAVLGVHSEVNQPGPGWLPTWKGVKSSFGAVNKVNWKHVMPILGGLGIAFPLSFMLFGPAALIPLSIIAGSIITLLVVHKVLEYRATRNMEQLEETKAKLPLIETIETTTTRMEKLPQLNRGQPERQPEERPREPGRTFTPTFSNGVAVRRSAAPIGGDFLNPSLDPLFRQQQFRS